MSITVREEVAHRANVGVIFLAAGLLFAALSGALMKLMAAELHPIQITWGRYIDYIACVGPVALWRYGSEVFNPPRIGVQAWRSAVILAETLLFIYAAKTLPLAEAIAIIYVYPFVVTLLSPWLLGERMPPIAWFGCFAGFAGVLIVVRPETSGISFAAAMALVTGVMYALHLVFTRIVAEDTPPLVSTTFLALVALVLLTPSVPLIWENMGLRQTMFVTAMGIINAIAHLLIIMAFARSTASGLAPFAYVEIVWAIVRGFLFFSDIPDAMNIVGMAVIVTSGVLVSQAGRIGRLFTRRRGAAG